MHLLSRRLHSIQYIRRAKFLSKSPCSQGLETLSLSKPSGLGLRILNGYPSLGFMCLTTNPQLDQVTRKSTAGLVYVAMGLCTAPGGRCVMYGFTSSLLCSRMHDPRHCMHRISWLLVCSFLIRSQGPGLLGSEAGPSFEYFSFSRANHPFSPKPRNHHCFATEMHAFLSIFPNNSFPIVNLISGQNLPVQL